MVASREGFQRSYDLRRVSCRKILIALFPPRRRRQIFSSNARFKRTAWLANQSFGGIYEMASSRRTFASGSPLRLKKDVWCPSKWGTGTSPWYALAETLEHVPESVEPTEARILSPFDNLIIQRERLRWIFEFDYQLESYVPAAKRRYGHFVLPVLWGDPIVARLESKALRERSKLALTGLWFEPGYEKNRKIRKALRGALENFAAFNGCIELDDALLSRG